MHIFFKNLCMSSTMIILAFGMDVFNRAIWKDRCRICPYRPAGNGTGMRKLVAMSDMNRIKIIAERHNTIFRQRTVDCSPSLDKILHRPVSLILFPCWRLFEAETDDNIINDMNKLFVKQMMKTAVQSFLI